MSLYIDINYLKQIKHRLPRFKQTQEHTWSCRCIICGDSKKKQSKVRGFFYKMPKRNDLYYKCHNCSASMSFGNFLKWLDPNLYDQYVFERYAKGENGPKSHKNIEEVVTFEQPVFKSKELIGFPASEFKPENIVPGPYIPLQVIELETKKLQLEDVCCGLYEGGIAVVDEHHRAMEEAIKYITDRKIPRDKWDQLYFVEHAKDMGKLRPEKYGKLENEEPRLVLPFYDERGRLTGITMRGIRGEALRYITLKYVDDAPLIFGLNGIDRLDVELNPLPIYVLEGPIDSLFIPNAIAVSGVGFNKLEELHLPKEQLVIIFDNQPRNKDVIKQMTRYIALGYQMVIWPCSPYKDVNEMVEHGVDVMKIIQENTYSGLMAELKMSEWRNC